MEVYCFMTLQLQTDKVHIPLLKNKNISNCQIAAV